MAIATARLFAEKGDRFYLLARKQNYLESLSQDLKVRGASDVNSMCLDVTDYEAHIPALDQAFNCLGRVDLVLIAHGVLIDQIDCERSITLTQKVLSTNAVSTILLLTDIANRLEKQKEGVIAVITSVAGDRGRCSNYVYGCSKGMVSIFLEGLGSRLHSSGVNVLDIKPGFVDTPMTAGFTKGVLWAQPDSIAQSIYKAIIKTKSTQYTPWFWYYIMIIFKIIPAKVLRMIKI